jgi:carbonic anhydrase/acetyltransferase-like protein (isoleucine patch superfamily)
MTTHAYNDRTPHIDPTAFIAPGARIAGDVEIGPEASVWFNAVLRGDSDRVVVGARTNVQDNAVLHTDPGKPCQVGDECTIGHGAIVHGCRIGHRCLVGMGAIILSGAVIGDESLVSAGALIPEDKEYPPRSLLVGSPVRLLRELSDEDIDRLIKPGVEHYLEYVRGYRSEEA